MSYTLVTSQGVNSTAGGAGAQGRVSGVLENRASLTTEGSEGKVEEVTDDYGNEMK